MTKIKTRGVDAAKGLEFPIVVIGDISYGGGRGGGVLVDPELGVIPPAKDEEDKYGTVYRVAKQREKEQTEAEAESWWRLHRPG